MHACITCVWIVGLKNNKHHKVNFINASHKVNLVGQKRLVLLHHGVLGLFSLDLLVLYNAYYLPIDICIVNRCYIYQFSLVFGGIHLLQYRVQNILRLLTITLCRVHAYTMHMCSTTDIYI